MKYEEEKDEKKDEDKECKPKMGKGMKERMAKMKALKSIK